MKSKIIVVFVGVLLVVGLAFNYAGAEGGGCPYSGGNVETRAEGGVINDVCPVMGGAVDKNTSIKVTYKGKEIGFCCAGCVSKFNADPEKYMSKMADTKKSCAVKG